MTATNAVGTGPASVASVVVIPGVAVIDDTYETGYQILQTAYNADTSSKKIMLLGNFQVGGLAVTTANAKGDITVRGGYDNNFSGNNGQPSILGKVTLSAGTTRFQNVVVRP